MAKTRKTRTSRTPKPIPAMLEGSFATKLENLVAEQNNRLARQGLLTDDPQFEFLRVLRKEITKAGIATFQRVAVGGAAVPAETAEAPSQPKQRKARTRTQTPSTTPEPTPEPSRPVRECSEDEVMSLVVEGTMGQDDAPYGVDSDGAALAPYGVKNDGTPKKRRGRGVPPWEREEQEGAEASDDSEDTDDASEDSEETETAQASDDSEDMDDDDDAEDSEEDSEDDEDLDDDSEEDADDEGSDEEDEDEDDGDLDLSDDELEDILADI